MKCTCKQCFCRRTRAVRRATRLAPRLSIAFQWLKRNCDTLAIRGEEEEEEEKEEKEEEEEEEDEEEEEIKFVKHYNNVRHHTSVAMGG